MSYMSPRTVPDEAANRAILRFEVGPLRFGLRTSLVRELARAVPIVPLPGAPPVIEGVVNMRGTIVPMLDLRARFGLDARPIDPDDHMIFSNAGTRVAGFRVDRAMDIVSVPEELIDAARAVTPAAEYLEGFAKLADGLVLIHDPASFLSRAESSKLDEALGTVAGPDGPR